MVDSAHKSQQAEQEMDYICLPDPIKWASVSIADVISNNLRLDASAYSIEAINAVKKIKKHKNGFSNLYPNSSFVVNAFHAPRFKRNYIEKTVPNSVGFLGSAEMLNIKPEAIKFIPSKQAEQKKLYVTQGTILMSCSGTIGKTTFVNKSLEKFVFSQHIIRLICKKYSGYVYAFLNTDEAQYQVQALIYGATIPEIEPYHLKKIIIPNAPDSLKKAIHDLVVESYDLRDQSNDLIDQAEQILYEELQLKLVEELETEYFDNSVPLRNYITKFSELRLRLDGSYHISEIKTILNAINLRAKEVIHIGDKRISSKIILPGRFKRVYVEKHNGIPFSGGKQLLELNPSNIKYLSLDQHSKRISEQLFLKENMVMY